MPSQNLGLIEESKISRTLPWRRPTNVFRVKEDVRPIFWYAVLAVIYVNCCTTLSLSHECSSKHIHISSTSAAIQLNRDQDSETSYAVWLINTGLIVQKVTYQGL